MQPDTVTADINKSKERRAGTDISLALCVSPRYSNDNNAAERDGGGQKD